MSVADEEASEGICGEILPAREERLRSLKSREVSRDGLGDRVRAALLWTMGPLVAVMAVKRRVG
jgi:hypothetical protein